MTVKSNAIVSLSLGKELQMSPKDHMLNVTGTNNAYRISTWKYSYNNQLWDKDDGKITLQSVLGTRVVRAEGRGNWQWILSDGKL